MRAQARLMARKELEARLAKLNMTSAGAESYGALLTAVHAHIAQLRDLLERACVPSCRCGPMLTLLVRAQTWRPVRRSASG